MASAWCFAPTGTAISICLSCPSTAAERNGSPGIRPTITPVLFPRTGSPYTSAHNGSMRRKRPVFRPGCCPSCIACRSMADSLARCCRPRQRRWRWRPMAAHGCTRTARATRTSGASIIHRRWPETFGAIRQILARIPSSRRLRARIATRSGATTATCFFSASAPGRSTSGVHRCLQPTWPMRRNHSRISASTRYDF